MLNEKTAELSEWQVNKTFKPTVKCPPQQREMPVAYDIADNPVLSGTYLLENLHLMLFALLHFVTDDT